MKECRFYPCDDPQQISQVREQWTPCRDARGDFTDEMPYPPAPSRFLRQHKPHWWSRKRWQAKTLNGWIDLKPYDWLVWNENKCRVERVNEINTGGVEQFHAPVICSNCKHEKYFHTGQRFSEDNSGCNYGGCTCESFIRLVAH